jgi:hypothetical protein
MATDEEIMQLYNSLPQKQQAESIVSFYRLAEIAGKQAAILEMEKELVSDATIESAMKTYGLGRRMKASTITMRALLKEAIYIAKEKLKK